MHEKIRKHYHISKQTLALIPSYRFDSITLAIEYDSKYYVKQPAMHMIKTACLNGFSSYEGRREAAIHQTQAKHKVPIAIYPNEDIFAFPSHSPSHFDCHWLFHHHIQDITPVKEQPRQCIITFSNSFKLLIPVSPSMLEKQLNRTYQCIYQFNQCKSAKQHVKTTHPQTEFS